MTTKSSKQSRMIILDSNVSDSRSDTFMKFYRDRVIGQPNGEKMAQLIIERTGSKLRNMRKPIAVAVAIGPSRSGKSYSGHVLAEFLHGDPEACIELEGADYTERHQVQDLKGAAPTYVGFMTEKEKKELKETDNDPRSKISTHNLRRVRLNSNSEINVVILNEFEKAHIDFYKFWMGVFDKGYATLGDGEKVDFRNTVFIITMNLGMEEVEKIEQGGIGFTQRGRKATQLEVDNIVARAMQQMYKREFRNRLDCIAVFKPHDADELLRIVDTELALIRTRMTTQLEAGDMFELEVEDSAKKFLLDKAMADGGSVAELSRVIEKELVTRVDRLVRRGLVGIGDKVVVFHTEGATELTTGLLEGEGDVAEVDRMAARGERHSTGSNAVFQRKLHAARQLQTVQADELDLYAITVWSDSERKLMEAAGALQGDLLRLYELKPVNYTLQMEKPYMACVTVRTTAEMAALIQTKFPKATIVKKELK